jgi:hypothetical protein
MPEQAAAASRPRTAASQGVTEPAATESAVAARTEAARVIVAWAPAGRAEPLRPGAPRAAKTPSETTQPHTTTQKTSRPARTPPGTARPDTEATRVVTARGAILALLALFLSSLLMAGWFGLWILPGIGYMAGCVIAPSLVSRRALLQIVAAPPALFLVAVVVVQVLTAQGSSRHGRALSVVEGTVLTLAATAPWLLLGTALGIASAMRLGLIERVSELRADLRRERDQRSEPDAVA